MITSNYWWRHSLGHCTSKPLVNTDSSRAYNSTDEAEGTLPTNRPPPVESPTRIPEEPLGGEDFYGPHDVDMGMIDDFGAELCFCSPTSVVTDCPQATTKGHESSMLRARDRQRYTICVNTCIPFTFCQGTWTSSPCFGWFFPNRKCLQSRWESGDRVRLSQELPISLG